MSGAAEDRIDTLIRTRKDSACLRIGIAGGSGSGKTTVCDLLHEGLLPCAAEVVSLDRFFKPVEQLPRYYSFYHDDHRPDFYTPDSLLAEQMVAYCRQVTLAGVVIFDGHFLLYYPEMRELMDIKCFVTVEVAEMLERRTTRNLAAGYGGGRENILAYNRECVAPRHEQFIQPTQRFADLLIPNGGPDTLERDAVTATLCQRIRAEQALAGDGSWPQ